MAKRLKDLIEEVLENLTGHELKRFKRKLSEAVLEPGYNAIPLGRLANARAMDVADAIVNHYREGYGLRVTASILGEINQRPLADRLLEAMEGGEGAAEGTVGGASGSSVPPRTKSEAEESARPPPAERHFVDRHREAIIARTRLVPPILDWLYDKQLLTQEQYDVIQAKDTAQNSMRKLYSFVYGWGRAGKDQLYEALKASNLPLIDDLEDQ